MVPLKIGARGIHLLGSQSGSVYTVRVGLVRGPKPDRGRYLMGQITPPGQYSNQAPEHGLQTGYIPNSTVHSTASLEQV